MIKEVDYFSPEWNIGYYGQTKAEGYIMGNQLVSMREMFDLLSKRIDMEEICNWENYINKISDKLLNFFEVFYSAMFIAIFFR